MHIFKMLSRFFLIFAFTNFLAFIYGVIFLFNAKIIFGENKCKMTFMFEYPEYVKIPVKTDTALLKYGLYAYSEGHLADVARSFKFTGAPVIFIPGNSGSHKQVRSLASVALRKGLKHNWIQHLDYFTVDFNEEFSALFGPVLYQQKEFLIKSIKTVLKLYDKLPNRPKQLILIGHSMGAKIAQSILTVPEVSHLINTIISISGPIDEPAINIDAYFAQFYAEIENYFNDNLNKVTFDESSNFCEDNSQLNIRDIDNKTTDNLKNVLLLSIGGGSRDVIVRSALTESKYSDIHVLATSITNVWVPIDHQCAVWCLQLVLVINRFLFSIIDINAASRNNYKFGQGFVHGKEKKLMEAHNYFVGLDSNISGEVSIIQESKSGEWIEENRKQYMEVFNSGLKESRVLLFSLDKVLKNEVISVVSKNIKTTHWIWGCSTIELVDNRKICRRASSLSSLTEQFPPAEYGNKIISIDMKQLQVNWTALIIRLHPSRQHVELSVDIYNPADRITRLELSSPYSYLLPTFFEKTIKGKSYSVFKLAGLYESYQSVVLTIDLKSCEKVDQHAVVKICVPWDRGCKRYYNLSDNTNDILIYSVKSNTMNSNVRSPIAITLHMDQICEYTISFKYSFGGTVARMVSEFGHWLIAYTTANVLLGFSFNIFILSDINRAQSYRQDYLLWGFYISFIIIGIKLVEKAFTANNISSMIILVLVQSTSYILLIILGTGFCIHGRFMRFIYFNLKRFIRFPSIFLKVIPLIVNLAIIGLSQAFCGGIGLFTGTLFYLFFLASISDNESAEQKELDDHADNYQNYKHDTSLGDDATEKYNCYEETVYSNNINNTLGDAENENIRNDLKNSTNKKPYLYMENVLIWLLLAIITILNFPSVISWVRNWRFSKTLTLDPSYFPAVTILASLLIICRNTKTRYLSYSRVFFIPFCLNAVLCLVYCQDAVYQLNGIISVCFIFLAIGKQCLVF